MRVSPRTFRPIAAVAFALLLALAAVSAAGAAKPKKPAPSLLVKFDQSLQRPVLLPGDRLLGRTLTGVDVIAVHGLGSLANAAARYAALPGVVYAEPNGVARGAALTAPNDPDFSADWAWQKIGAVAGWTVYPGAYSTTGGATIAIVDTGIDSGHPDLSDGRVLTAQGANCVNAAGTCNAGSALDDNGHGTHVAGIAAAATNNGVGVAGTAFDAQLIPVKVLDSTGTGSYAAITNGIVWAVQHGARAVNLSIQGSTYSQTLCDAVQLAVTDGAVVVAAAGNNSSSAPSYPAACPGAIGVAATDSGDNLASFSDYGKPDVFVSAPGASIYSTYLKSSYATMSGTSMATPFVTGLASQLLGQLPQRSPADVAQVLAQTSDKVGGGYGADPYGTCAGCTWSSSFGYGRIDLANALSVADFALSATPSSAEVTQGGSADYTVTASAVNGYSGTVTYSVSGLPLGIAATFSPPSTPAPGSTRMTLTSTLLAAPGTYSVQVVGTSGAIRRSTTVDLVVDSILTGGGGGGGVGLPPPPVTVPTGDFTLTVTPYKRVSPAGIPAPFAIVLGAPSAVRVDLSVSGVPPAASAVLEPSTTTAPGASSLTIAPTPSTPTGSYPLTITGTSGGYLHSATVIVSVVQPTLP
jgi:thermitase